MNIADSINDIKASRSSERKGAYKHLMTGVSFMIPFVVAGGILIALSFIFGIEAFKEEGTLAAALMQIGGGSAFALMVPILSGYIAFSIADRPGLVPGMVGGMLAGSIGSGFLGGLIAGFLAGYTVEFLKKLLNCQSPCRSNACSCTPSVFDTYYRSSNDLCYRDTSCSNKHSPK